MKKHILLVEKLVYARVWSVGSWDEALGWIRTAAPSGTHNDWQKNTAKGFEPLVCADDAGEPTTCSSANAMSQDTSLHANALAAQNLGVKQKEFLDALRFFPDATNAELAAHLQLPVNRITPRCLELRKQGLILEAGRRTYKATGGTAHTWKAKYPVLPPAREEQKPNNNQLFQ